LAATTALANPSANKKAGVAAGFSLVISQRELMRGFQGGLFLPGDRAFHG
jgi:hypothetical protein